VPPAPSELSRHASGKENPMRIILSVLLIVFPLSSIALANGSSDLPDKFMQQVVAGKGAVAVDDYFSTNALVSQKPQQIQFLKTQIDAAFNMYGKPASYELAMEEELAPSLKRYVFITKHDYHVLTWEFYVYRPKDTWIASNITFNDNFSLLQKKK
jgi:hypothetical protein